MAERLEKSSEGLPQGARPEHLHKTPDPRPHIAELDALRGIAALAVLMAHVGLSWLYVANYLPVPLLQMRALDFFQFSGFFMNVIFFVLSGYLLTWTEEERRKRQGGSYSVLNYAKRRALRLVPAYYTAIVMLVLVGAAHPSFVTVAVHLTFLHGFFSIPAIERGPFWTLSVEVAFYAMLPLLVLKFRKFSQRLTIFGLLLLVSVITRLVMVDALDFLPILKKLGPGLATYPTTWVYLCVGGVLIRMMVERYANTGPESSRRQLSVTSALTVVSVALLLVLTLLVFPHLGMKPISFVLTPTAMILEALAVLVFVCAVLGSPILRPVLNWGPLGFVGRISYSFYLLHGLAIFVVATYVLPVMLLWFAGQGSLTILATFVTYAFIVLAVTGTIAYLSFRYIEGPFMRIKPK